MPLAVCFTQATFWMQEDHTTKQMLEQFADLAGKKVHVEKRSLVGAQLEAFSAAVRQDDVHILAIAVSTTALLLQSSNTPPPPPWPCFCIDQPPAPSPPGLLLHTSTPFPSFCTCPLYSLHTCCLMRVHLDCARKPRSSCICCDLQMLVGGSDDLLQLALFDATACAHRLASLRKSSSAVQTPLAMSHDIIHNLSL